MADPTIRLRLLVTPDGSATLSGIEQVVSPLKKAVKDASAQASRDIESIGASMSKVMQRLRGFRIVDGKQEYATLTDILKSLDSMDAKLGKLTGRGFSGLTRSFKELGIVLDGIGKQLDTIAQKMGAVGSAGAGPGSASTAKPLTVSQALKDKLNDVVRQARPTGAMQAELDKNGDVLSLIAERALGDIRIQRNARTGSYRISMPNTLERNEAIKTLRISLAGATSLGAETLQRTGRGDITRELFQLSSGQRAYLYPEARNPYIRFMQNAPAPDPAAQAAAQAKAFADLQKTNRDFLTAQGYAQHRSYATSPSQSVEEWIKDGQITKHLIDSLSQSARVNIPAPRDPVLEAKAAKDLADRNKVIQDKLNSEGYAPTGKTFEQITEAGTSLVREFKNATGAVATFDEKLGKLTVKSPQDNSKAIADAQAKAEKFLAENNFKEVSRKLNWTPDGQRTTIQYKNAAGATASYDKEVGKLNAALPKSATLTEKLGNAVVWVGEQFGKNIKGLAVGALEKLAHPIQSSISFLLKLGGAIYTVKNLWRGFENLFVEPVVKGVKAVMDATEEYRQFELAIAGVVGGMDKARQVNDALVESSQKLPLTVRELQEIARGMAFMGPLTSRIALGSGPEVSEQVGNFSKMIAKLAIYDPVQGAQGAMLAMREAMSGELRSLRTRMEIPLAQVAATVNKTQRDLADNPRLLIQALSKWTDQYIPDSALQQRGRLYSIQIDKLQGSLRHAGAMIGESGLFDRIIDAISGLTERIFKYLRSDTWARRAQAISDHLVGIFDNIFNGIARGLRILSGEGDSDPIETMAGSIEWFTAKLDEFSKRIGDLIPVVVAFFQEIGRSIAELIGTVGEAASLAGIKQSTAGTVARSGTSDIRLFASRRRAVTEFLQSQGIDLRSEVGTQTMMGVWASPGDSFLKQNSGLFSVTQPGPLFFWEDLTGKATGYGDRVPYFQVKGRDADEQKRVEEAITRIENAIFKGAVATTPSGDYLPKFMNPAGLRRSLEQVGEGYTLEWLRSISQTVNPKAPPATPPATQPAVPVWRKGGQFWQQLPPEQMERFGITDYQRNWRMLAEYDPARFHSMLFKSIETAFGQMGQYYNPDRSPFLKMLNSGPGVIDELNQRFRVEGSDVPGNIFEVARARQRSLAQQVERWLQVAEWTEQNMPEQWQRAAKQFIATFTPTLEKLKDETGPMMEVASALSVHARNFGLGLAEQLEKESPEVAALFAQAIYDGTLGVQEDLKAKIREAAHGLSLPEDFFDFSQARMHPEDRARFLNVYFRLMERRYASNSEQLGRMALQPGVSGQQMFDRLYSNPSMQGQGNSQRELLKFYESHQGDLVNQFDEMKQKYEEALNSAAPKAELDKMKAALGDTVQAIDHLARKMRDLRISTNYALEGFIVFGKRVEEALENSVGDAIYNLITGTGTLKDALLGFARDVVRAFSQMAAHNLVAALLGPSSTAQNGPGVLTQFFTSIFGGAARGATAAPAANSANVMDSGLGTVGGNGTAFAATGAIWKGGFTPIYAFSQGGIVNRPVIGIVGEGKEPAEAMVPLPDGRSIPVTLNGRTGGDTEVKVYVVANYQEAIARGFKRNRDFLVDAIAGDVKKGGKVKKALRRVPG